MKPARSGTSGLIPAVVGGRELRNVYGGETGVSGKFGDECAARHHVDADW